MSDTTFDVEAIAAAESKVLVFGDGASIYRRHERGDCAYIIKRGQVEIREQGRAVEVMQPGEIFGEMALIDHEPRTASAVALGEVELIPIDRPLFRRSSATTPTSRSPSSTCSPAGSGRR